MLSEEKGVSEMNSLVLNLMLELTRISNLTLFSPDGDCTSTATKIALKRFRHRYLSIKLMRALMKLQAECFGPHRILDAWSQGQLPRGADSPEVSERISVWQAGGAAQK